MRRARFSFSAVLILLWLASLVRAADPGQGNILFEYFLNLGPGTAITDLRSNTKFPNSPDTSEWRTSFLSRVNWADNYGTRARAYVYPPQSGDYTFWIAGDDACELWLSTDDKPANAKRVAQVTGWTPAQDWSGTGGSTDKTQLKSAPVALQSGQRYYLEALQKEGSGGDSVAVAWGGPGIAGPVLLGGAYCAPLIRMGEPLLNKANTPRPADGATEVISPVFQWTSGAKAVMHEVYMGTNPTPGPAEFMGPSPVNLYFHISGLAPGATYYWRVDEVDAAGNKYIGPVWSFVVQPREAHNPTPGDGALGTPTSLMLTWMAGQGAAKHRVYFSDDRAKVVAGNPSVARADQSTLYLSISGLKTNTVYYWRVDEIDEVSTVTPGPVWHFKTAAPPTPAHDPYPADGATRVSEALLRWQPGENVISHNVYFGVVLALGSAQLVSARQTGTTYTPVLEPGRTYYWRIDEIGIGGTVAAGPVWHFTTRTPPPPTPAYSPNPPAGASGVSGSVLLTWQSGKNTVRHNVYFGTTQDFGAAKPVFTGPPLSAYFLVSTLEFGRTYYWRVDEIGPDGTAAKGPVWHFTVGPRRITREESLIWNYTPLSWQRQPVPWNRDLNLPNKIDDTIDQSDDPTFSVVINYRHAVQDNDLTTIRTVGPQSILQRRLKYLSSVAARGLTKTQLLTLAADPGVAFIEQQFPFTTNLDVSLPTICVVPPPKGKITGCLTTVPESITGAGINIAIFDTGVDNSGPQAHDAFAGTPLLGGYDVYPPAPGDPDDDAGHGTHVASIALGRPWTTAGKTYRGVAPGAGLIDIRVVNAKNNSYVSADPNNWSLTVAALETLYDNRGKWQVNIVNMSLEQTDKSGAVPSNGLDAFSQLVDLAEAMGIVVVASGGNDYLRGDKLATPAAATKAITVASLRDCDDVSWAEDSIADSSNWGRRGTDWDEDGIDELKPEVAAPGEKILAAQFNSKNGVTEMTGTSMAAPHIAGVAALILQARPGINAASVKDLILTTARHVVGYAAWQPTTDPIWNEQCGWGAVNASAAINLTTQTDLAFPCDPCLPDWLSPGINHTPLIPGQVATITARICNKGPSEANNVRVHFGAQVFSATTPVFYDIGTKIVKIPVNPAGYTEVPIQWTPLASTQCFVVEIGYGPDTDFSNNTAQRSFAAQSPVTFEVRNTLTEEATEIKLKGTLADPNTGWAYRIEPASVKLAARDRPALITAEVYPPPAAPPGSCQTLHVEAIIDSVLGPVVLGGVSVEAVVSKP